jgi:hypothetical protein
MRRSILLVMVGLLMVVAGAGVALAVTKTCTSVPCRGTSAADVLRERVGNGKRDVIIGGRSADRLRADRYGADTDNLDGGRGNDRLNVLDGDFKDRAVGGPGNHDVCFVDDLELSPGSCERFVFPPPV